jgi:putative DNA primase/helicase
MRLAEALTRLAGLRACGSYWVARCPAHDDTHASLSIRAGDNGQALLKCFAGCDYRSVIWALKGEPIKRALGLPVGEAPPPPDDFKRIEQARRIWREARNAANTLAAFYLEGRGITIPPPPTIRYAPSLRHLTGAYAPAMVCAVQSRSGTLTAVQRIYLSPLGSQKAHLDPAKASLGLCAGGAVRLAAVGNILALAEGVETGLSVMQATHLPVWATLGTSGLRSVVLPEQAREIIIACDGDTPGEGAANDAALRFIREGRRARIARPARGRDFNDYLREESARAWPT